MASVTNKHVEFNPIVITLETPDEAELFYEMLAYNCSIPDVVYKDDPVDHTKLSVLMSTVRAEMTRVI